MQRRFDGHVPPSSGKALVSSGRLAGPGIAGRGGDRVTLTGSQLRLWRTRSGRTDARGRRVAAAVLASSTGGVDAARADSRAGPQASSRANRHSPHRLRRPSARHHPRSAFVVCRPSPKTSVHPPTMCRCRMVSGCNVGRLFQSSRDRGTSSDSLLERRGLPQRKADRVARSFAPLTATSVGPEPRSAGTADGCHRSGPATAAV